MPKRNALMELDSWFVMDDLQGKGKNIPSRYDSRDHPPSRKTENPLRNIWKTSYKT